MTSKEDLESPHQTIEVDAVRGSNRITVRLPPSWRTFTLAPEDVDGLVIVLQLAKARAQGLEVEEQNAGADCDL